MGLRVGQVEQTARPGRPQGGDVIAPEGVLGGAVDGVVLAVEVLDREAAGDRLLIVGLGGGGRVRLAGAVPRLGADHELDAGHRQQVAQLGRVEEIGRDQRPLPSGPPVADDHRANAVALHVGPNRLVLEQAQQPAAGGIGGQHGGQHGQGDPRLVAELRDAAVAGVERSRLAGLGGQGVMAAVILADAPPQGPVGGIDAELLDPGVFVGRDGLRGELAADPVGRLGQDDGAARPARPPEPRRSRPGRRR